ncbi:MAG: Kae1-associated serine/threonine protein kinase [Candidatus Marsarchaeota archaeon]|jgi:Kae1-associated kinase Bud32|nr:Kae1-associated serine/threonine protein kinase [Candidatus Marsarchaeota archaeon]
MYGSLTKIDEGAESVIYKTKFININCIVKERIVKDYRNKELDEKLRKERTANEARIITLASFNNVNVPFVLLVGKYSIIMSRIEGTNLNTLMNNSYFINSHLKSIIKESAKQLSMLHNINIVHGDFTPANIMVYKSKTYIIDFGLSKIINSIEDKAIDLLLIKRSLNKNIYTLFIDVYKKEAIDSEKIIDRLEEIEKRGRYQNHNI